MQKIKTYTLTVIDGAGEEEILTALEQCEGTFSIDLKSERTIDDKGESWADVAEHEFCPECGAIMRHCIVVDSVGNRLHECQECPDCGHNHA